MKKLISVCLILVMVCSFVTPTLAAATPAMQGFEDQAYKAGRGMGLSGEDLEDFVEDYMEKNLPLGLIKNHQQAYLNSSYHDKERIYSVWDERFDIYSYNSIVVGAETGFIEDEFMIKENFRKAAAGLPFSNDDRFLIKPIYDCITEMTLDGYLLTKTFDGQYSLFSVDTRETVITYDKNYDLAYGSDLNLLSFEKRTIYDITDYEMAEEEDIRILLETPALPARDRNTGKYGFINWRTGAEAIPFVYDGVSNFSDGYAAVKKGNSWGYIDADNKVVLGFNYGSAKAFSKGIAQVDKSFIDKTGRVLVTSRYGTLYTLGADYYMGISATTSLGNPVSETYAMEIFNTKGEKVYEESITGDGNINTRDVKDYEYLGNSRLEYEYRGKDTVINIPSTPMGPSTGGSVGGKFADVPAGKWYFDTVNKVSGLQIITGKEGGMFDPEGMLTIAEAVTLAAKTRASYNKETVPTVAGQWYAGAVQYAIKNNIIKAGELTDYNRNATRAEVAYLFANALPSTEYTAVKNIVVLPDVNSATPYRDSIFKLYNSGIVSGADKEGHFKPNTSIKRCEAAAIVLRVIDKGERVA